MAAVNLPVIATKYISKVTKLDFSNTSNLKTDIQNRISNTTEIDFTSALNDMKGDDKSGNGFTFSEITLLAMAYFIDKIFIDKLKDEYYTLEMIKGFLDANNYTSYTAIHEIDVEFFELNESPYFKHCWLIIQTAWFLNSEHFGSHQHIEYLNHYFETGFKLPIEDYLFDTNYLQKKYLEIDNNRQKSIGIDGYKLVGQWYHSILFLICNELQLSTKNFKITTKDYREYNPLTKTSRQLRTLMPFKVIECDIKSAFPTFLDIETGAKIKGEVYNNVMRTEGITRDKAKKKFNTMCNSGAYHCVEETIDFLVNCGYTLEQSEHIVTLTHDKERKFFSYMTEYESVAISSFKKQNGLQRGTRLHDSVIFIDDKVKPKLLNVELLCDFGYIELNRPVVKNSFNLSQKRLPYAYISSIPQGLKLASLYKGIMPEVRGEANGFRIFKSKYNYLSAGFNINDSELDFEIFEQKFKVMLSTLLFLNEKRYSPVQLQLILKHIRASSNIIFNVRAMFSQFTRYDGDQLLIEPKYRDFEFISPQKFKTKLQFLNALNKARGMVTTIENLNNLFDLIQERVENQDYDYLSEIKIIGRKKNNLLSFAFVRLFNLLACGRQRRGREGVKSNPLYRTNIKRVTFKAMSLKPQQQNAFVKKSILEYEKQLKEFNIMINNREKVKQLILILGDITGKVTYLKIPKDNLVQNQIKAELLSMLSKTAIVDVENDASEFDKQYINSNQDYITPPKDLASNFEPNMQHSLFNQLTIEDANSLGEIFFNEYLEFHGDLHVEEKSIKKKEVKEIYRLPEIDFDVECE